MFDVFEKQMIITQNSKNSTKPIYKACLCGLVQILVGLVIFSE